MVSLFLEFNPPYITPTGEEIRYEFLNLEKYIRPENESQVKQNQFVDEIAEQIRCDRYIRSVKKDYSFIVQIHQEESFLDYFEECCQYYGIKYKCSFKHFKRFCKGACKFKEINASYCEKYRRHLLNDRGWHRTTKLKTNTAAAYYNAFLSIVELAYKDGMLRDNISQSAKHIPWNHNIKKEYLTPSEISKIERVTFTACPIVKQACLFSIFTGLRRADIIHLEWKDIVLRSKFKPHMNLTIRKTGVPVSLPLSPSAIKILKEMPRTKGLVFPGLNVELLNKKVPLLIESAKITKHITFHCFRHTFAMTLLSKGVDIYTIAKLLGHKSVASAQVYARP